MNLDVEPPASIRTPGRGTEDDAERRARLAELVKKDTLSYGEQLFVLAAMNDGLEF